MLKQSESFMLGIFHLQKNYFSSQMPKMQLIFHSIIPFITEDADDFRLSHQAVLIDSMSY